MSVKKLVTGVLIAGVGVVMVVAIGALIYNARPVSGTVTDKEYVAAHYVTETRCVPRASGGGCTTQIDQRYVPDRWTVYVDPFDGSSNVSRNVTETQFGNINIGDTWND